MQWTAKYNILLRGLDYVCGKTICLFALNDLCLFNKVRQRLFLIVQHFFFIHKTQFLQSALS